MGNKDTLNESELMQVIGGREEYIIPIPKPGTDFWKNWNPSDFIDPNAPIHSPA